MRRFLLLLLVAQTVLVKAQSTQYKPSDSILVVNLLKNSQKQADDTNFMLYFGRKLKNVPYVAKTLEVNKHERLIVNLRQLDCTTFVENVVALTLCRQNKKTLFKDFCHYLRMIRYEDGIVAYTKRLHYFTNWIADNSKLGFVKERTTGGAPFTAVQKLNIDYMSTHPQFYPMLTAHPAWIQEIEAMENELNGREFHYIPKSALSNSTLLRKTVKNGDILALITNKDGLDISHIGIAVWHRDGLHLLNASLIRKKVIEEPMLLQTYMYKKTSRLGIRVIEVQQN